MKIPKVNYEKLTLLINEFLKKKKFRFKKIFQKFILIEGLGVLLV